MLIWGSLRAELADMSSESLILQVRRQAQRRAVTQTTCPDQQQSSQEPGFCLGRPHFPAFPALPKDKNHLERLLENI